jgi:hypothetical protein
MLHLPSFSVSILYMKLAHDNLILKFKLIFIYFYYMLKNKRDCIEKLKSKK